jgi:hypothetical protein
VRFFVVVFLFYVVLGFELRNSRLCICEVGALPLEPCLQPFFALVILKTGSCFLPKPAWIVINHPYLCFPPRPDFFLVRWSLAKFFAWAGLDPPNLSLLLSWDDRYTPLHPTVG